jgi:hypothetical protein
LVSGKEKPDPRGEPLAMSKDLSSDRLHIYLIYCARCKAIILVSIFGPLVAPSRSHSLSVFPRPPLFT